MVGYLLDTNHVGALSRQEPKMMQKVNSLPPDTQLRACTITLGEVEAGNRMTQPTDLQRRNEVTAFINAKFLPNALPISVSTRLYYAEIIGRIWQRHPPASHKTRTEVHLVVELGVDINDVWIVAAAWEHGLILVTSDQMTCIREVVTEVQVECWL